LKESQYLKMISQTFLTGLWLIIFYVFVCSMCVCGWWLATGTYGNVRHLAAIIRNGRLRTFVRIHSWLMGELSMAYKLHQPIKNVSSLVYP
jgi:hypothetical protein